MLNVIPRVWEDLGFVPLVTPSSQIVGAQALFNVLDKERYKHLNLETVNLILGKYGKVPGKINDFLIDLAKKHKQDDEIEDSQTKKTDDETVIIWENFKDIPSERPVIFLNSLALIRKRSPSKKFLSFGPMIILVVAFIIIATPRETIITIDGSLLFTL